MTNIVMRRAQLRRSKLFCAVGSEPHPPTFLHLILLTVKTGAFTIKERERERERGTLHYEALTMKHSITESECRL